MVFRGAEIVIPYGVLMPTITIRRPLAMIGARVSQDAAAFLATFARRNHTTSSAVVRALVEAFARNEFETDFVDEVGRAAHRFAEAAH